MRVRIHLNLAAPDTAENVIKARGRGGWVTVAYATHATIDNVVPVVNASVRDRVRSGRIGKVPHAFLEGDLVAFTGRLRPLAPPSLKRETGRFMAPSPRTTDGAGVGVGYNPRFADCFYTKTAPGRDTQEFLSAVRVQAIGWHFVAHGARLVPLDSSSRAPRSAMAKTSAFEHQAIRRGMARTAALEAAVPTIAKRHRP